MIKLATTSRARRTDPATSHEAAKFAMSKTAAGHRYAIKRALQLFGPMTPRHISVATAIDYIEVQRRMSEVEGIERTGERHENGQSIWRAI